ncbi:MAG: hypothetical protein HA496_07585 [Thaumarchaeota archaeon]|nr:hypothetical protein [Nitrososphaerota archaeon]
MFHSYCWLTSRDTELVNLGKHLPPVFRVGYSFFSSLENKPSSLLGE